MRTSEESDLKQSLRKSVKKRMVQKPSVLSGICQKAGQGAWGEHWAEPACDLGPSAPTPVGGASLCLGCDARLSFSF